MDHNSSKQNSSDSGISSALYGQGDQNNGSIAPKILKDVSNEVLSAPFEFYDAQVPEKKRCL